MTDRTVVTTNSFLGLLRAKTGLTDFDLPTEAQWEWCGMTNGTAAVGSYQPNGWGVYDTHGNVWEWCLDWYAGSLAGGPDPSEAVSGSARVKRGGSWNYPAWYCRSAFRSNYDPSGRYKSFGFRVVRTLP